MRNEHFKQSLMLSAIVLAMVCTWTGFVHAQETPITVPNAGFEDRGTYDPFPESTDKYNQWGSEGWRHFQCGNNGGPLRIWNPGDPDEPLDLMGQGIANVGFGGIAPEGTYMVVVRSRYNDDLASHPGIRDFEAAVQILPDTSFDPTLSYKLTVEVGSLLGSENYTPLWNGYAVQLAVGGTNVDGATYAGSVEGGTVIAEDWNTQTVEVDEFVTATVIYEPDPEFDDLAGQPLQIRLCAIEDPDDHSLTSWAAFDDVQLVSMPATVDTVNIFTGDTNNDGKIDLADAISLLTYLFVDKNNPGISCLKSADANDDDTLNLADAISILTYQFQNGALTGPDGSTISTDSSGCIGYEPAEVDVLGCESPCSEG